MKTSYLNRMSPPQSETLAVEVEHQGQHYVVRYQRHDWYRAAMVVKDWPLSDAELMPVLTPITEAAELEWRQAVAEHSKPQPSLWQRGWAWLKART